MLTGPWAFVQVMVKGTPTAMLNSELVREMATTV